MASGLFEQFRSWYMYQPAPGYDGPLTIPVPIMSFDWAWLMHETKDPTTGRWKLGPVGSEVDTRPLFEEKDSTLEYPKWNEVIRGQLAPENNYETGPGDWIVPYTP